MYFEKILFINKSLFLSFTNNLIIFFIDNPLDLSRTNNRENFPQFIDSEF